MPHLQRARISRHGGGQRPPIGSRLAIGDRRALVGWTHYDDTPEGRQKGQVWCWDVSGRFLVYNASYNRSTVAGLHRDCGRSTLKPVPD